MYMLTHTLLRYGPKLFTGFSTAAKLSIFTFYTDCTQEYFLILDFQLRTLYYPYSKISQRQDIAGPDSLICTLFTGNELPVSMEPVTIAEHYLALTSSMNKTQ